MTCSARKQNCRSHLGVEHRLFPRQSDCGKTGSHAIYLAASDPRVPWYAKALAIAVAGYALSPIDLIPDFIPVIGYLDDLIIVPLGVWLVISLIPPDVMTEYRQLASGARKPVSRTAAIIIGAIWILSAVGVSYLAVNWLTAEIQ
jgi:uncharacterized membrane protein YkvA (DUF1232 family)